VRHRKNKVKLDRNAAQRRPLLRNLAISLIEHGRIKTTSARAKAVKPMVERLITVGRGGTLNDRRLIIKTINNPLAAHKVMTELSPKYKTRPGGYLRIIKLASRPGDGASQVLIEFV
jgi:large subunit ribosomal protein L17